MVLRGAAKAMQSRCKSARPEDGSASPWAHAHGIVGSRTTKRGCTQEAQGILMLRTLTEFYDLQSSAQDWIVAASPGGFK
jgi:hypothetical protein